MATQALYLKYRPQTFDEVVGQEPITRTLRNALRQGRLRHAYLFTGPRGTGKTTTARLLAKAVNCLAPEDERPCNACSICVAINEGRLLDLIEIDAASNRGIDEIREIREKVGFRPNEGRFKVYVLDEAHMLTEPAFNALLKTLEEPPPHVIFSLVTTDPHKIPATITSRCQRFDFKRVSIRAMVSRLAYIAEQEGLTVQPEALELIAYQGTGAMRDAISLLDQLTSYGDEIVLEQVQMVLGTVGGESAGKLAACLAGADVSGGLDLINRTVADGADPRQFAREVVEYLRGLLLIHEGASTRLLRTTAETAAEMEALAARLPLERLVRAIRLFNDAATDLRRGFQTIPQLPLELALVESLADAPRSAAPPSVPAQAGQPASTPAGQPVQAQAGQPAPTQAERPASTSARQQAGARPPTKPAAPATAPADPPREQPSAGPARVAEASPPTLQAQAAPAASGLTVEAYGSEIVVTFPYGFLRDKLDNPERKVDVQDAFSQVLSEKCRVRFVLASEYVPRKRPAGNRPAAGNPAPSAAGHDAPSAPTATADAPSAPTATAEADPPAAAGQEGVPEMIEKWAAERGAQAKIIP
ncbi:MAG: DNA polymerase III subunit gamma/tau [Anaerolineae bacterium]